MLPWSSVMQGLFKDVKPDTATSLLVKFKLVSVLVASAAEASGLQEHVAASWQLPTDSGFVLTARAV